MTIKDLHSKLQGLGISEDKYYLHGLYGSNNDNDIPALIIKKGDYSILYEIYYKERGSINSLKTFYDEDEACLYFLKWISE